MHAEAKRSTNTIVRLSRARVPGRCFPKTNIQYYSTRYMCSRVRRFDPVCHCTDVLHTNREQHLFQSGDLYFSIYYWIMLAQRSLLHSNNVINNNSIKFIERILYSIFFLSLFLFCSCFLSDFRFQKCKYGNVVCASRGLSLFLSLSLVLCNVCTARLPQQERYTHNTREMHIQHTHIAKLYQPYRIGLTDVITNKYRPK